MTETDTKAIECSKCGEPTKATRKPGAIPLYTYRDGSSTRTPLCDEHKGRGKRKAKAAEPDPFSEAEVRKEIRERKRSLLEKNREEAIAAREADLETLRTTPEMYVVSDSLALFDFPRWLANLHLHGGQIQEIDGYPMVVMPDTDTASKHGERSYRERDARLGRYARPYVQAMIDQNDLDNPPTCRICGSRQAAAIDVSGQVVICGDPACRVARRKAKGPRKSSSK